MLRAVTLPSTLTQIEGKAFMECTALKDVYNCSSLNIEKGSGEHGRVAFYAEMVHVGHSFDPVDRVEDYLVAEATCSAAALYASGICGYCGEWGEFVSMGELLPHTPGEEADCYHEQVCTVCSAILAPVRHVPGKEATCASPQFCTVCKTELAPRLEHTPGEPATCTSPQLCTVCGWMLAAIAPHTYDVISAVEPTFFEDGLTEGIYCRVCSEIFLAQAPVESYFEQYMVEILVSLGCLIALAVVITVIVVKRKR